MEWMHTVVVGSLCVVQAVFLKNSLPGIKYLPNLYMNRYVVPSPISIIDKVFLLIHRYGCYQCQP